MMNAVLYNQERIDHWNKVGTKFTNRGIFSEAYFQRLIRVYRFNIPEGMRVLELGCGRGDLLAALKPSRGVGIDFSPVIIEQACARHPEICFMLADAHDFVSEEKFDFVILSGLVNDLWDVQAVFENLRKACTPQTKVIVNIYSRLWELPLELATKLGLAKPNLEQNWLELKDLRHFLTLSGFEVLRSWTEYMEPLPIPLLQPLCNRYLIRTGLFSWMGLTNFVIARPVFEKTEVAQTPTVSVIVPARNEAGNIASILERVPEMGGGTEIVFVEGHSSDNTLEAIHQQVALHPERRCKVYCQTGKGKGDAVRMGFNEASGDVLMILDADLTVPPEDLPRFYAALVSGKGEFINGVRLIYPMEEQAMRFFNLLGNKFFSVAFRGCWANRLKTPFAAPKFCGKKITVGLLKTGPILGILIPSEILIFFLARLALT